MDNTLYGPNSRKVNVDDINNCISPSPFGPGWTPGQSSGTTITFNNPLPDTTQLLIRKVENGYIVDFNKQEYVFVNEYDIAAFISKNLTK